MEISLQKGSESVDGVLFDVVVDRLCF